MTTEYYIFILVVKEDDDVARSLDYGIQESEKEGRGVGQKRKEKKSWKRRVEKLVIEKLPAR
ncbi:hypothetical protein Lal_00039737 [Lupinus albus]|nr:hypothetical protein Lal_00039737 [Lupinus albus]